MLFSFSPICNPTNFPFIATEQELGGFKLTGKKNLFSELTSLHCSLFRAEVAAKYFQGNQHL